MESTQRLALWIDSYMDRLTRISYSYLHDKHHAEDCVQNAFIKAYTSMHQLSDVNNPFPWLVRIVINESKTYNRKRWREVLNIKPPDRATVSTEDVHFCRLREEGCLQYSSLFT